MTYWEHLTSTRLGTIERSLPVVLPMGAIEQHGPHLPLATDRMIVDHFCRELDRRLGDDVLILPTISVGYSRHHDDFPGTLSLSHETLLNQIVETADSALEVGMSNLLILNAHGGNEGIGQVALERIGHRWPDRTIVRTTWWQVAAEALLELSTTGPGGVGHACELETSLLLEIAASLVDTDAIPARQNTSAFSWDVSDMLRGAPAVVYRRFADVSPTGVFGDPRAATAEKGRRISEVVSARLVALVRSLREG
ncbi:creatininase family protein [Jiangella asiatica]|uniref:Creatininase family protein n=1 Tax=Jiangella asiatica TaxID=2530372 RepID=A0A4R5DHX3_9ACTN|nr:creatininase family protein [Jiangella asiatica]TDE10355.1 creatininase family protein [Jiangella asiatica]